MFAFFFQFSLDTRSCKIKVIFGFNHPIKSIPFKTTDMRRGLLSWPLQMTLSKSQRTISPRGICLRPWSLPQSIQVFHYLHPPSILAPTTVIQSRPLSWLNPIYLLSIMFEHNMLSHYLILISWAVYLSAIRTCNQIFNTRTKGWLVCGTPTHIDCKRQISV